MAGYFKTTKDFYRALWAWVEVQKYTNLMPGAYHLDTAKYQAYITFEAEVLMGFVRGWPDMPELKDGYELFKQAKALAEKNDPMTIHQCRKALVELKAYMEKSELR